MEKRILLYVAGALRVPFAIVFSKPDALARDVVARPSLTHRVVNNPR